MSKLRLADIERNDHKAAFAYFKQEYERNNGNVGQQKTEILYRLLDDPDPYFDLVDEWLEGLDTD